MGWLSGLFQRLKTGHAQGMDNVAMMAAQRCVQRFPEVFAAPPWDPVPSASLHRLHQDMEYSLAASGLKSAFETILSTGDTANAAIAILERAKLHARARDWEKADTATEAAFLFCERLHSQQPSNTRFSESYADALLWRGAFLAFGKNAAAQALPLLDKAAELYTVANSHEGLALIGDLMPHIHQPPRGREHNGEPAMSENAYGKPHCYLCAREGHFREMVLVKGGVMVDMTRWDKPWSPTQSCFQCAACGRLVCYTHEDNRVPCECGAKDWVEKLYLQKEFDNG